jgi:hypothetical protein
MIINNYIKFTSYFISLSLPARNSGKGRLVEDYNPRNNSHFDKLNVTVIFSSATDMAGKSELNIIS